MVLLCNVSHWLGANLESALDANLESATNSSSGVNMDDANLIKSAILLKHGQFSLKYHIRRLIGDMSHDLSWIY